MDMVEELLVIIGQRLCHLCTDKLTYTMVVHRHVVASSIVSRDFDVTNTDQAAETAG